MKAMIEFDLNEPEDRMAHLRSVKATALALVIWEFSYNSRKILERVMTHQRINDPDEVLDLVFDEFNRLIQKENIQIEELIN